MIHVHYDETTGEIAGWETTNRPRDMGYAVVSLDATSAPDAKTQKIDLETKELVGKTDDEKRRASLPTDLEVKQAILVALRDSDHMFLVDRKDIPKQQLDDWAAYRMALRDLSKNNATVDQMIASWPVAPDGTDRILEMRKRIK